MAGLRSESILILGLGGVGYYLAKRLEAEGYAITAIEPDRAKIDAAAREIDARLIRGDALSFESWKEVDTEKIAFVIAVTDNDAANILASVIADRAGVERKIARVRDVALWAPDALIKPGDVAIDMVIRPGEITAREIARLLKMRAGNVAIDVGDGAMRVMAMRVGETSELSHKTLIEAAAEHPDLQFRIVAIARGIRTIIPGGKTEILPGDHVFLLALTSTMPRLMSLAGVATDPRERVMIVGGGLVGARVAELLEDDYTVTLLEQDETRAEDLVRRLPHTNVLHGDGADKDTLLQAGLMTMDTIVTATGDNETNIMTSVLAKHLFQDREADAEAGRTIALVGREDYQALASSMGADVVLNRKVLAGNRILKYVRRGRLRNVRHLHGCDAEVVELVAEPGSPITRRPLADLHTLKSEVIVGAVRRDGRWSTAIGSTHIQAGDVAIAMCASPRLLDLQRLFAAG